MTTKWLVLALLAAGSALAADVSIGILIGPPPPPRVLRVRPVAPAPDWIWIEGYWYPVGNHYKWHPGYWTRPPYPSAVWVVPHYDGQRFFAGYWQGDRGRRDHDHRWDRDRNRDYERGDDHDQGRGRGRGRGHDRD